jgi:hypothetical protein
MTQDKREPVEYIVLEKSLVGNEIFEAGATVKYDGLPAENLKPTCEIGEARYQEYLASNAERVAKMKEQFSEQAAGVGDPKAFAEAFSAELAKANAEAAEVQAQLLQTLKEQADVIRALAASLKPADAAAEAPAKVGKAKAQPATDPIA